MKTLKQLCIPRQSVFDTARRDTVLSINNLTRNEIDPEAFFEENHLTQGMRLLLENGFKRLEGKSDQGVFRLLQAMGGGKTHLLITLGLLAKHPAYRARVMGDFYLPGNLDGVKVVTFSGRESDAPLGIWGSIAQQLGKKDLFRDHYSPLRAPGQNAWVNLLKGQPVLIILDEIPPYMEACRSRAIGNSDLSVETGTALANLFVAITESDELRQCALVITDLNGSYGEGGQQINQALDYLQQEAHRTAMDLEPVRMNTDEFYHILRKRLFQKLPSEQDIAEVAQGYARSLREARQMDITDVSPERFAATVMESYPFHPAIRDLYARFKENQGFQQTRGLIRLMRVMVSRLWEQNEADPVLLSAHHLDLNHRETQSEIIKINPTLENAIARDIASNGSAFAEQMDTAQGGRDASDLACLLLVSSLANIPGATRGLVIPEIVAHL